MRTYSLREAAELGRSEARADIRAREARRSSVSEARTGIERGKAGGTTDRYGRVTP